jgi:hypothetical protein
MSPPHIARYPIVIIAGRVTHEYATPIQRFAIRPETGRVCTVVPSARVAKLADAPDLGSGVHGRGGSSPPSRTTGIRAAPIGRSALVSGYADPATTSDDTFSALGIMGAPVDRYTSGYRSSSGPRGDTSVNPAVERRERCTPTVAGSGDRAARYRRQDFPADPAVPLEAIRRAWCARSVRAPGRIPRLPGERPGRAAAAALGR